MRKRAVLVGLGVQIGRRPVVHWVSAGIDGGTSGMSAAVLVELINIERPAGWLAVG
jgi:hypothetical protein